MQEEQPEENVSPEEAVDRYAVHREKWAFWSRALVRAGEDLRALLPVDESGFRFVAGTAHGDARGYFLYATLDEVEKVGVAVMGWDEVIGEHLIEPETATTRVILERTLNEQSFWTRKMLEVMIDLVCFSITNDDPYYRHLMLLRDLRQHVSVQQDLGAFYGAPSRNVEWSITRVYDEVRELEANIRRTASFSAQPVAVSTFFIGAGDPHSVSSARSSCAKGSFASSTSRCRRRSSVRLRAACRTRRTPPRLPPGRRPARLPAPAAAEPDAPTAPGPAGAAAAA